MRGRVAEAAEHLTFARVTEFREHEAAKISMTDVRTVKRDVALVRMRMRAHYFGLLDPHSSRMQAWDLLVILGLAWTVLVGVDVDVDVDRRQRRRRRRRWHA